MDNIRRFWYRTPTARLVPTIRQTTRLARAKILPRTGYFGQGVLHDRNPSSQSINLSKPCLVCFEGCCVRLHPAKMSSGVYRLYAGCTACRKRAYSPRKPSFMNDGDTRKMAFTNVYVQRLSVQVGSTKSRPSWLGKHITKSGQSQEQPHSRAQITFVGAKTRLDMNAEQATD